MLNLKPNKLFPLAILLLACVAGCKERKPATAVPVAVKATKVAAVEYSPSLSLTGEVAARVQSELSFRISGRIVERIGDVGMHVQAAQVLARLEPAEQRADAEAAAASVRAAEAKLRQVTSAFDRQKSLLADGFTTRRDHDNALKDFEAAKASLDNARAQLDTAHDQLEHAELRAPAPGIITTRNAEVGQVLQGAQKVFTLAQDGPRDVIVNAQESLVNALAEASVEIALATDAGIVARGAVREVSPAVDTATGTVRVKIALAETPPAMLLGSAVTITARTPPRTFVLAPASALVMDMGKPAVWLIEPASKAVSLQHVIIETFENAHVVVREGLRSGDHVVTGGAQLLRPSQIVTPVFAQGEPS